MAAAIAIFGALFAAGSAGALDRGTDRGIAFITGGIGLDEREELQRWERSFNLKIVTAARSGAYVASVHVDVHRGNQLVFDRTMDGPVMLMKLEPGAYVVTANANGVLRRQAVTVTPAHRALLVLQWDDAETGVGPTRSREGR